jgi:5-(carboxyamino)imidazole ribonucleotide synthase
MNVSSETCIGVLGGGQLGRMLALEARRMGFRVLKWTGGDVSGAARLADHILTDPFDCPHALELFVSHADVATVEFENIPQNVLNAVNARVPVRPTPTAVGICQNRELEKLFLARHGIPCAEFKVVSDLASFQEAWTAFPGPTILKTVESGYDGKGQMAVDAPCSMGDLPRIWQQFGGERAVLERKIDLAKELSVIVVRGQNGEIRTYDPAENVHRDHILDLSIVPARCSPAILKLAQEMAVGVAEALDYVGVLGVEFFVDQHGKLLVNEMAPRPHNSGHHTLDACETSQFEQQVRAVCGLPLGSTHLVRPAVMWNLLGDLWPDESQPPDWAPILQTPGAKLHLYGKNKAKRGRKLGHVNFVGDSVVTALDDAQRCRKLYAEKAVGTLKGEPAVVR